MTLIRPTIVLFDMDGTTVRHVNPRLLNVLEYLDDLSFKFARGVGMVSRLWRKQKDIHDKPRRHSPQVLIHRVMHTLRQKPVEKIVQPCPGIYTLLNFFKDQDIPMGLVSNGLGKGYGHEILDTFDLGKYFKATTFREDIRHSKPNPQPLLITLDNINLLQNNDNVIWYIGDRHKDVSAALAAREHLKGKIIPFSYGINAAVAILENGIHPDHIILNYEEFTDRISTLF